MALRLRLGVNHLRPVALSAGDVAGDAVGADVPLPLQKDVVAECRQAGPGGCDAGEHQYGRRRHRRGQMQEHACERAMFPLSLEQPVRLNRKIL